MAPVINLSPQGPFEDPMRARLLQLAAGTDIDSFSAATATTAAATPAAATATAAAAAAARMAPDLLEGPPSRLNMPWGPPSV